MASLAIFVAFGFSERIESTVSPETKEWTRCENRKLNVNKNDTINTFFLERDFIILLLLALSKYIEI